MPTFAELMDRDDATPEQLREALNGQRERRENTWSKNRQESLSHSEKSPDAAASTKPVAGRKKKKESGVEQLNIRLNNAQREVLGKLTDKLGISKSSVMKLALMTLNQQYK